MAWLVLIAGWWALEAVVFTVWRQKRHEATVRVRKNAIDALTRCPSCGVRRVHVVDRNGKL